MLWNTSHNLFVLFFLSTELLLTLLFLLVSLNQLTFILFTHVLLLTQSIHVYTCLTNNSLISWTDIFEIVPSLLFIDLFRHTYMSPIHHMKLYLVFMGLDWWFRPPPAGHRFKRSSRLSTATQLSSWHEGYSAVCATGHKLTNTKLYYCEMIGKRMCTWMNPFLVSNITTILEFHSNNYN